MHHNIHCISCGMCVRECALQMSAISKTGEGVMIDLDRCNRCGHCAAICPTGSMNHPDFPPQEETGTPPSPEDALRFLRTPRSVRQYKPEPVPKEVLLKLVDAGRYPQTSKNSQGIGYVLVCGQEKVQEIGRLYEEIARELPRDFPQYDKIMRPVLRREEEHFDALFYGCPQLIFAVADETLERWKENAQFSFTFISLMAPSLGLGTCWCGQMALLTSHESFMRRFAALLELPEGLRICGCMMAGYPAVSFRRLVARDPLKVLWR